MRPCSFIVLSHPHTCLCGFVDSLAIPTSLNIVNVFISCIIGEACEDATLALRRCRKMLGIEGTQQMAHKGPPSGVQGHPRKFEGLRSKVVYPKEKCGECAETHKFVLLRNMLENSKKTEDCKCSNTHFALTPSLRGCKSGICGLDYFASQPFIYRF